jgi:hypothetical protein
MRPIRFPFPALPATLLATLLGASPALAEEVADVPTSSLPTAGTCAPIEGRDAILLLAGPPTWYRIAGEATPVQIQDLPARLAGRLGSEPARRSVWVVAAADRPVSVVQNLLLKLGPLGVHRVGVQVRSESGEGVMGFPLFLRPGGGAAPPASGGAVARRLPVRVERGARENSDPRLLFEAARRASQKFGKVAAEISIHSSVSVQDAVSCIDMLYRGGCGAVRVSWSGLNPYWRGAPGLRVQVTDRTVGTDGSGVEIPAIRARKAPWGDEGANEPGSDAWVLEDLSADGAARPDAVDEGPYPGFCASPDGVPAARWRAAGEALSAWGRDLARDLAAGLTTGALPAERVAARVRADPAKSEALLGPARRAFPAPERVLPSNLRAEAYLFAEGKAVGKVDLTIHLAGGAPSVVFGRWVVETFPDGLTLPPLAVDPYSFGVPGHLRVWIEGLLLAARREGAAGIPLTPEAEVLPLLPAVAHADVRRAVAARAASVEALAKWLQATRFDRILLLSPEASVAVVSGGKVSGILYANLDGEARDLLILGLRARAAR